MQQIKLSDHTADKAQQAQKRREDEYAARMTVYRHEVDQKNRSIEDSKAMMRDAWRDRRILASIGHALKAAWRSSFGWPNEPVMQGRTVEEHIWSVGGQGEARVAEFLARQLGDDWILVSGYRNGLGEIDQVLIGPRGLFTIEIKNINGTVTVDGDHWTSDKYDNYGNLVERGRAIADKGGRSPSRQLNEPTNRMVEFLRKSLPSISASRIVVLSHEKSAIARVSQPTAMPVVLNNWSLSDTLMVNHASLLPAEQARVIELLQRDHAYHQKRREQRGRASVGEATAA